MPSPTPSHPRPRALALGACLAASAALSASLAGAAVPPTSSSSSSSRTAGLPLAGSRPNVVIFFCDDWAYGDLGANGYGAETPNMDAMVSAGMRSTDFHAMSVCTPSRAALQTGRLGLRTGVVVNFWVDALGGLPRSENTIAELLKPAGYDSKIIGKWHLGHRAGFHPTFRGYDEYLGAPYSVDMASCATLPAANLPPMSECPTDGAAAAPAAPSRPVPGETMAEAAARLRDAYAVHSGAPAEPALPLYNSTANCTTDFPAPFAKDACSQTIVEQPAVLQSLTAHYAAAGVEYVNRHAPGGSRAGVPFLLYMPFSHIHVPLAHDPKWTNKSKANTIFADTLLELDDAVGQVWGALTASGLDKDTLVILTGDNGPWLVKCELAGNPGPFAGEYQRTHLGGGSTGKMSTWEAGHREAGAFVWPGRIPAGVTSDVTVSTLDIVPTVASLAGITLPSDREYDGVDLSPVLFQGAAGTGRDFLFHPDTETGNITAVRYGKYKAFFETASAPGCKEPGTPIVRHPVPLIFDLEADPAESAPLSPPPAGLVESFQAAFAAKWASIQTTFRSAANYSGGGQAAWGCCDPSHVVCRCTN